MRVHAVQVKGGGCMQLCLMTMTRDGKRWRASACSFAAGAVTALLQYVYSGAITYYCTIFYYFYLGVSFVLGVN